MVELIEALLDVSLQKPVGSFPSLFNLAEGRVTSPVWAEPMRRFTELRLVVRLKQASHDFLKQFVREARQTEWSHFPLFLRHIRPSNGCPTIASVTKIVDDLLDFGERHGISGFWCRSRSHRAVVGVDASVSSQVEIRIVELPIEVIYRYSSFASI